MRNVFAQMDEEAEAEEDGHGGQGHRAKLKAELAVREIQEVRLSKRGGGTRKLTLREQLLLRSLLRPPAERSDDDVSLIVKAVRARNGRTPSHARVRPLRSHAPPVAVIAPTAARRSLRGADRRHQVLPAAHAEPAHRDVPRDGS